METQRVVGNRCYRCGRAGHLAKDCSDGRRTAEYAAATVAEFPSTHCPCGGGVCVIMRSKKSGRAYYSCPGDGMIGMRCQYFKWCDELKHSEILNFQPYPYPICSCKAGVSRLEIERNGPNAGCKYFACRVKKGNGACNFRMWYDDYVKSALAANEIVMIREALENGEIELDFPFQSEEAVPEMMELNASGDEIFASANEINMIREALENGEIELDFPFPFEEALPDEMELNASGHEVFAGDVETPTTPSPRQYLNSDASHNGYLSGRTSDGKMENRMPPLFTAGVETPTTLSPRHSYDSYASHNGYLSGRASDGKMENHMPPLFIADVQTPTTPSPRQYLHSDASHDGHRSGRTSDGILENHMPPSFTAALGDLASSINFDDGGWWF